VEAGRYAAAVGARRAFGVVAGGRPAAALGLARGLVDLGQRARLAHASGEALRSSSRRHVDLHIPPGQGGEKFSYERLNEMAKEISRQLIRKREDV
jgi:hypothetical protein